MKLLPIIIAALCVVPAAAAQYDPELERVIAAWKAGDPLPPKLLAFPDGVLKEPAWCGTRGVGGAVADYLEPVQKDELLAGLLLDPRARPDTVRAAATRLVQLRGPTHLAKLLTDRHTATRTELAVLAQLLRSPYARLRVLRIDRERVDPAQAMLTFLEMQRALEGGSAWDTAFREAGDKHPDVTSRSKYPGSTASHVTFLRDGVIAPTGFDIQNLAQATDLPSAHLTEVFRVGRGTHVFQEDHAVYLYHAEQIYPAPAL